MPVPRRAITRLAFCCLMAGALFLAGCSALMETGARRNTASVAQSSYGAADMLIQQSRSFLTTDTPLEVGVITDLDSPNERTNFGSMVAEQIASRFVQLGYNVTISEMPAGQGAAGRSVITGRYAVARDGVLVNLRIVESGSGKVLAAYDYTVPKTPDVRELTRTDAEKKSLFGF